MLSRNIKFGSDGIEPQTETVIAQISDLHFTSRTSHDDFEWKALSSDLKKLKPKVNLLVVTGDLIDGGFGKDEAKKAFENVSRYLNKLCKDLGLDPKERLVVVPGNHDYRFKGIFGDKVQRSAFLDTFKDYYRPVLIRRLGVCVFVLDSNSLEKRTINLATGLVEKTDLVAFSDFFKELQDNKAEEFNSCIKIALLHHHPMPIAAIEGKGVLDQPGFLLLKNAGQFMTSMVNSKIDLILHGHQHYPALSKASYPNGQGAEHLITIIGAGSVGRQASNYERSYNIVSITPNREIHSERRALIGAEYSRVFHTPVRTFEEARRQRFEALALRAQAQIRARKFSRVYVIKSGSGDADLYERLESVNAYSEDVNEFQTAVTSDSGFFYTPEYECSEGQNITWIWKSADFKPPKREATVFFDPPLNKDRSTNYELRRKAYNLFHFNKQERRDATNGESGDEYIELAVQNAFDLLVLTVLFPEGHWPNKFYRMVHDDKCFGEEHGKNCTRDLAEEENFNLRFSKFKDARTIVVSIEKPLPGYTYWIRWSLPDKEADESDLNATDQGHAMKLAQKLLALRDSGNTDGVKIKTWFENMRTDVITSKLWTSKKGDDELELSLYIYDSHLRGLVCVANSLGTRCSGVIKSGQTLIGAAYRRREHMLYSPIVTSSLYGLADSPEYINRVPGDWRASAENPYTAICAIPVIYPIKKGCRIGVVTFATKSPSSRLLHFVPQKSRATEVEAAGVALVGDVRERQIPRLAAAFGI